MHTDDENQPTEYDEPMTWTQEVVYWVSLAIIVAVCAASVCGCDRDARAQEQCETIVSEFCDAARACGWTDECESLVADRCAMSKTEWAPVMMDAIEANLKQYVCDPSNFQNVTFQNNDFIRITLSAMMAWREQDQ